MKIGLYLTEIILITGSAAIWSWFARRTFLPKCFSGTEAIAPPFVSVVAIILGFFIGFGGADMRHRSRQLQVASHQEANQARSILRFAEGAGVVAEPIQRAVIKYLEAVATTELDWIESNSTASSPAQPMADSLVLVTTVFALQAEASDAVKSLLISGVNRLRQERVSCLALSRQTSSLSEWFAITGLVLLTQAMLALAQAGKPRATMATEAVFLLAVLSVFVYLAWIDGIFGPSQATLSIGPLKEVHETVGR